jgi:AcrR family transcriptional regulator
VTAPSALPRPPLQARTREGWSRILAVGLELLEQGGWEALTIAEVCRRAPVSAPTIYARVDGREGLFAAVYEYGMEAVRETERRVFGSLERGGLHDPTTVVRAVAEVFDLHSSLLRAVISRSSASPELLARGSAEAHRVIEAVARLLAVEQSVGRAAGRLVFSEALVRVMYGSDFYVSGGESGEAFAERLGAIIDAMVRPNGGVPGSSS